MNEMMKMKMCGVPVRIFFEKYLYYVLRYMYKLYKYLFNNNQHTCGTGSGTVPGTRGVISRKELTLKWSGLVEGLVHLHFYHHIYIHVYGSLYYNYKRTSMFDLVPPHTHTTMFKCQRKLHV